MAVSWDRDREQIERELQADAYQKLLRRLQRKESLLRQFGTWADVLLFMRGGTGRDQRKDRILRQMFRARSANGDPRWHTVLLATFWPALKSIHAQKRHWDPNADERWQDLLSAFYRVIHRIDVERRPDRLAQKVYNDTVHELYAGYRRTWMHENREFRADPGELEAVAGLAGIDFANIERREAQDIEIDRLREHLGAGRITEAGFVLLVYTRVFGKSIASYAREFGLKYPATRKRRWRIEKRIRRFELEEEHL